MHHSVICCLHPDSWFSVVKPIKIPKPIIDNPVIIGFDSEFEEDKLLSLQFWHPEYHSLIEAFNKENNNGITKESLAIHAKCFLKLLGIPDCESIYLISHFSQAEVSNISNYREIDLLQINKSLVGSYSYDGLSLHLIDLFSFFPTSLEKIGDMIGISKISLEGIDGKDESYWKSNMSILFKEFPEVYKDYAITDAKIAYHAYTSLRDFFIKKYELDILHFATIPSIAGYIFRRKYLRECPTPVRIVETPINQRSNGKWYRVISKSPVYAGSLDVRYMALSAYHGARVESFCRGRLESVNLVYYDVDSLYPSSCMLQPLPCKDTEWIKLPIDDLRKQQEIITRGEGFVEVEFSFPSSINYPCLPVIGIRDNVLYFPLSGISYATLSELRLAIKLGLNRFKILSGFAFMPTSKEINHPLKQYMMALHELKHKSSKGSIDYQMYKLLMNALVGKLIERQEDDTSLTLLKEGFISRENYSKVTRRIKSLKHAGSLFLPEYASLILGKARSIIGEFVAKGSLFVSTDSVLLPANVDISCDALRELKSVGSNLKKEFNVTHGIIIRSRLYALNPLEDNPNNRHIARHGVHLSVGDFLVGMRQAYFSKSIPNLEYTAKKLIRLNEAIRKGIPLNTEVEYQSKINLSWDGKRNLLKLVDNPFADFSLTRPLLTIPNERKKKKKSINIDAVISLLNEGLSQRKIAKELGVTQQYISKLLKEVEDAKFSYKKL